MNSDDQPYAERENLWDQQWPDGTHDSATHSVTQVDSLDELTAFPGVVGTADAMEAVRDGEPYVPPIDPPVLPGGPEGIHIAAGFGTSADESQDRSGGPLVDDEIRNEVMRALQHDSLTSHFTLDVAVRHGIVRMIGTVGDIDDSDHAISVVEAVVGVQEVIDHTTLDPTLQ